MGKGGRYPNCNQEGVKLLIIITIYSGGDTVFLLQKLHVHCMSLSQVHLVNISTGN